MGTSGGQGTTGGLAGIGQQVLGGGGGGIGVPLRDRQRRTTLRRPGQPGLGLGGLGNLGDPSERLGRTTQPSSPLVPGGSAVTRDGEFVGLRLPGQKGISDKGGSTGRGF